MGSLQLAIVRGRSDAKVIQLNIQHRLDVSLINGSALS
jgi:hypothetical protein